MDEHKEKTEELNEKERKKVYSAGESLAESPMEEFTRQHGVSSSSEFGQDLKESMRVGYGTGNARENQQGNDPETG